MQHNAYPEMLKQTFIIIFLFFSLWPTAGCISLNEYAIKYRAASSFQDEADPNEQENDSDLKPSKDVKEDVKKEQKNKPTNVHVNLRVPTHHCHYFRNQLVVASEVAQEHLWWVWAFPGYWPLHILTLYILPVDETRTANKVIEAAQKMEMAYQTNDAEFLNTCERLLNEPELGAIFAQENPLLKP
jgi:hypothetical protein